MTCPQLEPFIDTQRGYKLYKPSGWNQFAEDPGVSIDIKFQDIIETETTVQVSSSPVSTATSVTALGEARRGRRQVCQQPQREAAQGRRAHGQWRPRMHARAAGPRVPRAARAVDQPRQALPGEHGHPTGRGIAREALPQHCGELRAAGLLMIE